MRHHVRYNMMWGHKISQGRGQEPIEVSRADYNAAFGSTTPDQPEVPEYGWHMWETWWRLNARRPTGEGSTPIAWGEIQAFCALTGEIISPKDVKMLESLDNAYLIAVAEERRGAFERAREENAKPNKKASR